jgi:dUTPase
MVSIKKGDKIAQVVVNMFVVAEDDEVNKERKGGFGSTNKQ